MREHVARCLAHGPREGVNATAVPGLWVYRSDRITSPGPAVYGRSIFLVCQGRKRSQVGDDVFLYDPDHYLVTAVPLPVTSQLLEASAERPFLSLAIDVELADVREVLSTAGHVLPPTAWGPPERGLAASPVTAPLRDVACRLLELLDHADDAPVLGLLYLRELLYLVLKGPQGGFLRAVAMGQGPQGAISEVLTSIHTDCAGAFSVPELAARAGMSESVFYEAFKAVTGETPMQYIKRLRLQEAHRQLTLGLNNVSGAAYGVGYNSRSQFSREFTRVFGANPSTYLRTEGSPMVRVEYMGHVRGGLHCVVAVGPAWAAMWRASVAWRWCAGPAWAATPTRRGGMSAACPERGGMSAVGPPGGWSRGPTQRMPGGARTDPWDASWRPDESVACLLCGMRANVSGSPNTEPMAWHSSELHTVLSWVALAPPRTAPPRGLGVGACPHQPAPIKPLLGGVGVGACPHPRAVPRPPGRRRLHHRHPPRPLPRTCPCGNLPSRILAQPTTLRLPPACDPPHLVYACPVDHPLILRRLNLLSIVLLVGSALLTAGSVVLSLGIAWLTDPRAALAVLPSAVITGVVLMLLAALTWLAVISARGVIRGRGRWAQTVLALVSLPSIPFGTAYGLYALWVCWIHKKTRMSFRGSFLSDLPRMALGLMAIGSPMIPLTALSIAPLFPIDTASLDAEHEPLSDRSQRVSTKDCGFTRLLPDCRPADTNEVVTEEVSFALDAHGQPIEELKGTLYLPQGLNQPRPGVILVHGSGPTDRHAKAPGELVASYGKDPLPLFDALATHLASKGLVVLAYDKRSCVACYPEQKEADWKAFRFQWFIDDALSAADFLASRPEVRDDALVVVGHSQGGQLAPHIAARDERIAAVVMLAGFQGPFSDLMVDQLDRLSSIHYGRLDIVTAWMVDLQAMGVRTCLKPLKEGDYDPDDGCLGGGVTLEAVKEYDELGRSTPEVIGGLDVPLAALAGTVDRNVAPEELLAIRKAAKGLDAEFHLLPGVGHGLTNLVSPSSPPVIDEKLLSKLDYFLQTAPQPPAPAPEPEPEEPVDPDE